MTNHRHLPISSDRAGAGGHCGASGRYRWSSYQANAQGEPDALVQPYPLYIALQNDAVDRQAAYREWSRYEMEPGLGDEIFPAINGNVALGSERFAAEVGLMAGRRAMPGQSGQPSKSPPPENGEPDSG